MPSRRTPSIQFFSSVWLMASLEKKRRRNSGMLKSAMVGLARKKLVIGLYIGSSGLWRMVEARMRKVVTTEGMRSFS